MKSRKNILFSIGQIACIVCFAAMLLSSALVLDFAKKGLIAWRESVLPLLLPFIILSKFWIYYKIPEFFFCAAQKIFRKKPLLSASLPVFLLGLCSGFPIGAVFVSSFYEQEILEKRDAEELLPLVSFVSPMFVTGYVRPLLQISDGSWINCLIALYLPVVLFYLKMFFVKKGSLSTSQQEKNISGKQNRYPAQKYCTPQISPAKKKAPPKSSGVTDVLLSSLEIIFLIGIYMMLFSVLFGLLTHLKISSFPGMTFFFANLEVTTGIHYLAGCGLYSAGTRRILLLATTAFGGICTMAQVQTVTADTGLSIQKYAVSKLKTAALTAFLSWILVS